MSGAKLAAIAAAIVVAVPAPAHAYEFWVRSRTIGQAYQLRAYKLIGPDLFVGRRRYTQTLALRIMDIGDLEADRKQARLPDGGLTVSWQSYLRIDHDFGSYSMGRITLTERTRRARSRPRDLGDDRQLRSSVRLPRGEGRRRPAEPADRPGARR
jgi:hypothetical protein